MSVIRLKNINKLEMIERVLLYSLATGNEEEVLDIKVKPLNKIYKKNKENINTDNLYKEFKNPHLIKVNSMQVELQDGRLIKIIKSISQLLDIKEGYIRIKETRKYADIISELRSKYYFKVFDSEDPYMLIIQKNKFNSDKVLIDNIEYKVGKGGFLVEA